MDGNLPGFRNDACRISSACSGGLPSGLRGPFMQVPTDSDRLIQGNGDNGTLLHKQSPTGHFSRPDCRFIQPTGPATSPAGNEATPASGFCVDQTKSMRPNQTGSIHCPSVELTANPYQDAAHRMGLTTTGHQMRYPGSPAQMYNAAAAAGQTASQYAPHLSYINYPSYANPAAGYPFGMAIPTLLDGCLHWQRFPDGQSVGHIPNFKFSNLKKNSKLNST
ncbi:hypothetical protein HOLleu_20487 [Holothuria leucospilota]|uniref:Uncharacterized protein n=1 Tax=Holothuria leucospilota TaxID=206669 RepID=A0A9Q1C142_HOLLE|nr:hypothetical protein HOLleu_20487 [Holothuria leucospilota]